MPKKKMTLEEAQENHLRTVEKYSNEAAVPDWWGDADEKTRESRRRAKQAIEDSAAEVSRLKKLRNK